MILTQIILVLFIGGFLAWRIELQRPQSARWISLIAIVFSFVLLISFANDNHEIFYQYVQISQLPWI
ncbi:MAG: hypothetical protein P8M49_09475, partial [Thalassotalea sp.]|nr:hypothetical protein [Thalassotalea sp.]